MAKTLKPNTFQRAAEALRVHCATLTGTDFSATVRTCLAQIYVLIDTAPPPVRSLFSRLSEGELERRSRDVEADIRNGKFGWQSSVAHQETLMILGSHLRALDRILNEEVSFYVPMDPHRDWYCEAADVFVIPLPRASLNGSRELEDFARRGLIFHRVLPGKIRDIPVRLYRIPGQVEDGPRRFAAALFSNFSHSRQRTSPTGLVYSSISVRGGSKEIAEQIEMSGQEGAFCLAWAELMIDEGLRSAILAKIRDRILEGKRICAEFIVAGSWHEGTEDFRNVSYIFDGYGTLLLTYQKLFAWRDSRTAEDIEPGMELPVLVAGRTLVSFAICRDFCERAETMPVLDLGVDYFVVPSLGDRRTAEAHLRTADEVRNKFRAGTFVVQQFDGVEPPEAAPRGYVVQNSPRREAPASQIVAQDVGLASYEL